MMTAIVLTCGYAWVLSLVLLGMMENSARNAQERRACRREERMHPHIWFRFMYGYDLMASHKK